MITPDMRKILKDMASSQYGVALQAVLDEKLTELKDLQSIKSWEETLGRQHAEKLIKEIFNFMEDNSVGKKSKNIYT